MIATLGCDVDWVCQLCDITYQWLTWWCNLMHGTQKFSLWPPQQRVYSLYPHAFLLMDTLLSENVQNNPKPKCKYTKHVPLTIPTIPKPPPLADSPEYHQTSSSGSPQTPQSPQISPTVLQLIWDHAGTGITLSQSPSPTTPGSGLSLLEPFSHEQQPILKHSTQFEHIDLVLQCCQDHFDNLAEFLDALFTNIECGSAHTRIQRHWHMVRLFLQGKATIKPVTIVEKIYNHWYSFPAPKSTKLHERNLAFDPCTIPNTIDYAWPSMSCWALRLVGNCAYKEIGNLAQTDSQTDIPVRLAASTKSNTPCTQVVTWEDISTFTIASWVECFKKNVRVSWYLTECMAGPHRLEVIICKWWPHPMVYILLWNHSSQIQVAAILSFVLSRNRFTNGYITMHMGIWHFTCKSHIDVKHVYCWMGLCISDMAARKALATMSSARMASLQEHVSAATMKGEAHYCIILDNIQQYIRAFEPGI